MHEFPANSATTRFRYSSEMFVIRLWREESAVSCAEWHGRIQHIASGEIRFFHDWDTFIGGLTELTRQIRVP